MKVFISWSGSRSRAVAAQLKEWIPDVMNSVETWMSSDIHAGARWIREVDDILGQADFGIVCLTRDNLRAPWILFEAGAIAKKMTESRVIPYLMDDLEPADVEPPLGMFQSKRWDREGTWQLVHSINSALRDESLPKDRLERAFEAHWPRLEEALQKLRDPKQSQANPRSSQDMLKETVELGRQLSFQLEDVIRPINILLNLVAQGKATPSSETVESPQGSQAPPRFSEQLLRRSVTTLFGSVLEGAEETISSGAQAQEDILHQKSKQAGLEVPPPSEEGPK